MERASLSLQARVPRTWLDVDVDVGRGRGVEVEVEVEVEVDMRGGLAVGLGAQLKIPRSSPSQG